MQIIVSSLLCILAICTVVASFNAGTLWVGPCRRDMNRGVGHLCAAVQGREPMSVLAKEVFDVDHRPVILYDGVCNMCNNFVTTLLDLDKEEKFRFSALQGQTGQALLVFSKRSPTDISSIVLVEKSGECRVQSDAVLRIGHLLGGPARALLLPGYLLPKFLRDRIYDTVAENRYSFLGKREECRCSDVRYADRFI